VPTRRLLTLGLGVAALAVGLGGRCGGGFKTIAIDAPTQAAILDETPVAIEARVEGGFDQASVEVRIGGVDLIAALGLAPPFSGAGGQVLVGSDLLTISGFDFTGVGNPRLISLDVEGLSLGPHTVEVLGLDQSAQLVLRSVTFQLVDHFTQRAGVLAAAGLPEGPAPIAGGAGGELANATFGQPFAAPPIPLSDGSELRPGFVEVAEASIAGGN
jgi:hypothetical protein